MPTPNLNLNTPAHLSLPGAWDTPLNDNFGIIDTSWGGVSVVAVSSTTVTLTTAQAQNKIIVFTGTLSNNVQVNFPAVGSHHVIYNQIAFSGSFAVKLKCGAGLGVAVPASEAVQIITDGTNVYFVGLPPVGAYVDLGTPSVPQWITQCDIPPFLYCNGSSFNTSTYPVLFGLLGSSNLPDARGRSRFGYNDGTNRVTIVNGDVLTSGGGDQRMPSHNHDINDPGHAHSFNAVRSLSSAFASGGNPWGVQPPTSGNTDGNSTGITVLPRGSGTSENLPPCYIGGITMIRAG